MRRILLAGAAVVLAAFLPGASGRLHAAEAPLNGVWKISALTPGRESPLFLVEIKDTGGAPAAEVLSTSIQGVKDFAVTGVADDAGKSLHMVVAGGGLSFAVAAYAAKPGEKTDELLGTYELNGRRALIRLERSDLKELPRPAPPGR